MAGDNDGGVVGIDRVVSSWSLWNLEYELGIGISSTQSSPHLGPKGYLEFFGSKKGCRLASPEFAMLLYTLQQRVVMILQALVGSTQFGLVSTP